VQRNDLSTLLGDVNNQKFTGGILITLEKPTKPMRKEAADAGRFTSEPIPASLQIEFRCAGSEDHLWPLRTGGKGIKNFR
jgi:hypothetical protein